MRRLPIALAIALLPSIALAHDGYGGGHRGGWHGGYYARGGWGGAWGVRGYYVLPDFAYPNAYPVPYYPGYVPENLTYCDRNSGTYIDEDGARHLCR
jgi:hypothetical protein